MPRTFALLLFGIFTLHLSAQTICPANASGAATCADACISCAGGPWSGLTEGYTFTPASGFCGILENARWFGFVAGTNSATFTLLASDCRDGAGLEMAVFETCGAPPIACSGNAAAMTLQLKDVPLAPGHNYRVVVDGYRGDECRFNLSVSPAGATQAPAVATGLLEGPARICPGGSAVYRLHGTQGAVNYVWKAPADAFINGQTSPLTLSGDAGKSAVVTFGHTDGAVSVQGSNVCRMGETAQIPVAVKPIPPTILPEQSLCNTDTCQVLSDLILQCDTPQTRTIAVTLVSTFGCDSTVLYRFREMPSNAVLLPPVFICRGDSTQVWGQWVQDAGTYRHVNLGWNGCDSTEYVQVIWANPGVELKGATLACYPPEAILDCRTSLPNVRFEWSGPGDFQSSLPQPTVRAPGLYRVTVTDLSNGCTTEARARVRASAQAPAAWFNVVRQGQTWRIYTQTQVQAPAFEWTGPENFSSTAQHPAVNRPGRYTLHISNDNNGCQGVYYVEVDAGGGSLGNGGGNRPVGTVWHIAPNPVKETLHLYCSDTERAVMATAVVVDALGRRVGEYTLPASESVFALDLPGRHPGVYRLFIQNENGSFIHHLSFICN